MGKLEKLIQDSDGSLRDSDSNLISPDDLSRMGKMITLVVVNPSDVHSEIEKMAKRDSVAIPPGSNAYVASDFSGDTQHIRKDEKGNEKMCSVYAVQFYYLRELPF
jgi:hypothetical protein